MQNAPYKICSSQAKADLGDRWPKGFHICNQAILLDSFSDISDVLVGASFINVAEIAKNGFIRLHHTDNGWHIRCSFLPLVEFRELFSGYLLRFRKILRIARRYLHYIAQQQL